MNVADDSAANVAEFLLRIKAVELSPQTPFRWSSGILSPIYCDNRRILSHQRTRTQIAKRLSEKISKDHGDPDAIVGVATGGIGIGILVAQELGLPFAYVRGEAKSHGKENAIEGALEEGADVIVVEDLISTGSSSLNAVERLRSEGHQVKGLVAIFSYGFEEAEQRFKEADCCYSVLTDFNALLRKASEQEYIAEKDLKILKDWHQDPKDRE